MSAPRSDALVFFGATGDLAYRKIFPSLSAMVKRGHLDLPVIGVARAGWTLDQMKARAKDSLEKHGGLDRSGFAKLSGQLRHVDGDYNGQLGEEDMDAYERVLTDAMDGDATLFARQDYVEEAWRIVDPVLQAGTPVFQYEPQTWGPKEIEWVTPPGGWQDPVVSR